MNRRTFLKGLTATATGLLIPSTEIVEAHEPIRRYWALDSTMVSSRSPSIARGLDDTAYLQDLIDQAHRTGVGIARIPPGTYHLTQPLMLPPGGGVDGGDLGLVKLTGRPQFLPTGDWNEEPGRSITHIWFDGRDPDAPPVISMPALLRRLV